MSAIHKIRIGFDERTAKFSSSIKDLDIDLDQLYVGRTISVRNLDSKNIQSIKFQRSTGNISDSWMSDISTGSFDYTLRDEDLNRYICVQCKDKYDNVVKKTFYFSSLPVVYINTKNTQEIGNLDIDAHIRI